MPQAARVAPAKIAAHFERSAKNMKRFIEPVILTAIVFIAIVLLPSFSILRIKPRKEPVRNLEGNTIAYVNLKTEENLNIGIGYSLLALGAVQIYQIWRMRKK